MISDALELKAADLGRELEASFAENKALSGRIQEAQISFETEKQAMDATNRELKATVADREIEMKQLKGTIVNNRVDLC